MARRWTTGEVLQLATDAAARSAARRSADPRRWSEVGGTESLLWGRYAGSGQDPYEVTVDLTGPAFRCTCPSLKLPCKHAVALLLMHVEGPRDVAVDSNAAVLKQRSGRTTWVHAAGAPARAVDPDAQAQRTAKRIATMSAGMDDLERWLLDLARAGTAAARRQPYAWWDTAAARLVDAQLPALAERVRTLGGEVHARTDWSEHLLAELGRCYLAVRAWHGRETLDEALLADLRVVIGWSRRTEEVLAGPRVADRWIVTGRHLELDARLQSQRTWMVGERTGQVVLLLDFAHTSYALPVAQVVGSVVAAELALHPGSSPRRALLTGDQEVVAVATRLPFAGTLDQALASHAAHLADNPWAVRSPVGLAQVTPVVEGSTGWLVDRSGRAVRLDVTHPWPLLALTGGRPADVFGEWQGGRVRALSAVVEGALVPL